MIFVFYSTNSQKNKKKSFKICTYRIFFVTLHAENNMKTIDGYWNVTPQIKDVTFPVRGKMQVALQDGRLIVMPLSAFPSVKKVPVRERKNWYRMAGGFTWDSCPEVIHVEQILGNYALYNHDAV